MLKFNRKYKETYMEVVIEDPELFGIKTIKLKIIKSSRKISLRNYNNLKNWLININMLQRISKVFVEHDPLNQSLDE